MKFASIIFDLDGTLLDSSGDILSTLSLAIEETGLCPAVRPDKAVVGPAVSEMLKKLLPSISPSQTDAAVSAFRKHYDASSYPGTKFYPGMRETLDRLRSEGVRLFIATNKPEVPTRRVLDAVHAGPFDGMVCVNSLPGRTLSKADMISKILVDWQLDKDSTLMVGDCDSDMTAAKASGIKGAAVLWGYGMDAISSCGADFRVSSASELIAIVL